VASLSKVFAFCCTLFETLGALKPYLDEDTLHLICEVEVPFEERTLFPHYQCTAPTPVSDVTQDIRKLLEWNSTESFSDFIFRVEGKEFHVHRNILASRSPVFRKMFELNMREKQEGVVRLEDISAHTFSQVLHYIYTGECSLNNDNTEEMLAMADRYDLEKLKLHCANVLSSKLELHNAAATLYVADTYHALELKKQVFSFIADHFQAVMTTDGFKELCNKAPQLVAETVATTAGGNSSDNKPRSCRRDDEALAKDSADTAGGTRQSQKRKRQKKTNTAG